VTLLVFSVQFQFKIHSFLYEYCMQQPIGPTQSNSKGAWYGGGPHIYENVVSRSDFAGETYVTLKGFLSTSLASTFYDTAFVLPRK